MSQRSFGFSFTFPYKTACFCLLRTKSKTRQENSKTISDSSPNYDLFNHANESQAQTCVTVPLRSLLIAVDS
jgi:hypothetical protein